MKIKQIYEHRKKWIVVKIVRYTSLYIIASSMVNILY